MVSAKTENPRHPLRKKTQARGTGVSGPISGSLKIFEFRPSKNHQYHPKSLYMYILALPQTKPTTLWPCPTKFLVLAASAPKHDFSPMGPKWPTQIPGRTPPLGGWGEGGPEAKPTHFFRKPRHPPPGGGVCPSLKTGMFWTCISAQVNVHRKLNSGSGRYENHNDS